MNYGYMGKVLRVNLFSKRVTVEDLNMDKATKFIGGRGLGTAYFMDEVDPRVDALSPDNKLIVATGPLTGTPTPTGGRYMVITKAPLTGTIASSNSGGYWGAEFKCAGYDMIIVEGKSEKPVYLEINDDVVNIHDANEIWGKLTNDTTDILEQKHEGYKVLNIGPAGENLSPMAAIMNDRDRAAGRSGVGAVMGSKNLKAIVVKGSKKPNIFNQEQLKEVFKDSMAKIKENPVTGQGLGAYGSAVLVNIINENGIMPTNNFQTGHYELAENISGEKMAEDHLVRKDPCYRCPIACGRRTKTDNVEGGGPEYETIWAFGSDCGIDKLDKVIEANYWCNEMGLDTITAGSTIAAAMELYEKGYIKDEDVDGPALKWGNADAIIEWTKRMGTREGLGNIMSEGSYRLGQAFGCTDVSMTVKKQEIPAYDPRGVQGQGLEYATSNRGGCHVRGYMISPEILGLPEKLDRHSLEGKEVWTKIFQDLTASIDSLGLCLFTSFAIGADEYANLFNAVTGTEHTAATLLEAGDRIYNIERLFNLSNGFTKEDDTLPKRLLEEEMPEGPTKGKKSQLNELLPKYYEARGWDENGVPTEVKLKELGL